jgi:hypothetical protein
MELPLVLGRVIMMLSNLLPPSQEAEAAADNKPETSKLKM